MHSKFKERERGVSSFGSNKFGDNLKLVWGVLPSLSWPIWSTLEVYAVSVVEAVCGVPPRSTC
jgi:hypothetical protein